MARISQVLKNSRQKRSQKNNNVALAGNPQRKVVCLRLTTISPKKPNSANRRIAKVSLARLNKRLNLNIKIPGEGHNLQQHSTILIRAGRARDLIGVSNVAVRGKLDLFGVTNRKTSRSIYGVKSKKTM
jgi:small subunit ribosomal protein S12